MIKSRIRKRDGRKVYDVRLRDPDGREYSRTFETKAAAQDFEASERTSRRRNTWIDPRLADLTVREIADRWKGSNPSKRARSVDTDAGNLEHALNVLGGRPVGSVTRADVQGLVDTWKTTHAASTVQRMYSTVRAVFNYAEAAEVIGRSPCRHIRLPQVGLVERPTLNADHLERLADELGPDQAAMMWIAAVLGARWAEAAGLTVGSIDPLRGTISISRQLGRDGVLAVPKSAAGTRRLAAPVWLLDDLAALLARRGLTGADPDALVFVNSHGRPWEYSSWRRARWVPACKRAGLPGLRFHDLRSNAATALVAAGVDLKTAQTRLGHANPHTTLGIYARASAEADRRAAEKMGEFFRPRDGRGMDGTGEAKN
jgi:integrase